MENKDFTQYTEALELKKLGFDEPCMGHYSNGEFVYSSHTNNTMQRFRYAAPLYSQAFRWFREKYGLNSHIHQESRNNYSYCCGQGYSDEIGGYQDFETYEEAELECLKKLIEIVKGDSK